MANHKIIPTADGTTFVATTWELIHLENGETVVEVTATAGKKTHITRMTLGSVDHGPIATDLASLQAAIDEHRKHAAEVAHARNKVDALLDQLT